ncbi:MAG: ATP-binding protein [Polaromonas sp.]|uniref:AAA family ATPase n=1 Tax=Polaromonas sp. TaxID=1869339 RepID=UPI002486E5F0|nr:ATP-binding protein [Polaromonas sp.]MDI1269354.1 ATP-binding protein [Polaromonas sp.]
MLHRYAFSNFQSFRERTEVSWLLDGRVPAAVWSGQAATAARVSTVMAVIGPNASGKTALLKPILFLDWFMRHSFGTEPSAPLPLRPHAAAQSEPTEFEVEADFDGRLWRYTLRCTPQRVLHEALYVKHERMRYVFVREWNESSQSYDVKQQDFGLAPAEARKVRPNASLIATAAQYGVPLAQRLVSSHISTNIHQFGRLVNDTDQLVRAATHFAAEESQRQQLVRLLAAWDLGLSDLQVREMEAVLPDGKTEKFWLPFGIHRAAEGVSFELPFALESSGTQGAFVLLGRLLPVLAAGGLAVIDEFENDLHPHMLEPILDLFANPATNPHRAQLLFTCHAMEVLNILHKSQVMLVEKDENNESSAWRLDTVDGIRSDDNFYAKYMAGAFGAVPQL